MRSAVFSLSTVVATVAFMPAPRRIARVPPPRMNLFGDLFDDSKLKPQKPYERPLFAPLVKDEAASYQLQEKMFSLSGEDFRVRDIHGDEVIQIGGANINIGGVVVDKMYFKDASGKQFCSVERRILATTTCYDICEYGGVSSVERLCAQEPLSRAARARVAQTSTASASPRSIARCSRRRRSTSSFTRAT